MLTSIRTILHPTDFSKCSAQAFAIACSFALDYDATLVVLHVAEAPIPLVGEGVLLPPIPVDSEANSKRLRSIIPTNPRVKVEYMLIERDPAGGILMIANRCGADLIVMGTHGRTGLNRLMIGSVAEMVVRGAACPVLTTRGVASKSQREDQPVSETALASPESPKVPARS